jgi:glycosyltransferase involved in cell wall biosynthesis
MSKRKVVFLLPSLSVGGMEQEVVQIVKYLDKERFEGQIWLFSKVGKFLKNVPPSIKVYGLKRKNKLSFFKVVFNIANLISVEKPDLIIQFTSAHSGIFLYLGKLISGNRTRIAVFIRNVPSYYLNFRKNWLRFLYRLIIKVVYPHLDYLLVNSIKARDDLKSNFKLNKPITFFPSTIDYSKIQKLSRDSISEPLTFEKPTVLAISRLVKQKRLKLLLKSFSILRSSIDCQLIIISNGQLRFELENFADKLGVENNVKFLGYKNNPWKFMRRADIFVLTSLYEGLPHVLLESMACGLPIVVTQYPGVEKLLINNKDSVIVKQFGPENLARKMKVVLQNKDFADNLKLNGIVKAKEYDIQIKIRDYEQLFERMITE